MGILVSSQSLSKSYSSRPVFADLSLGIEEGDRIGLIGPNGSGKSTLLKVLAGLEETDQGEVISKKQLRVAYVPQEEEFEAGQSVRDVVQAAVEKVAFEEHEREASIDSTLKQFGFKDRDARARDLSGGWRKRLSLACGFAAKPELLFLDEPTNHLDLASILWLEGELLNSRFSYVVISHDRAFLQDISNRVIELNPRYPQGFLSVSGDYQQFLTLKEEKLAEQKNLEKSLASQVRRELAWLSRGARARATKSRSRIEEADQLVEELNATRARNLERTSIDAGFQATGRRTKELISMESGSKSFGEKTLFDGLDCLITPGTRLGLVGQNGSGKTTLLRVLVGDLEPDSGKIKRADELKVVWFEQDRASLDKDKILRDSFNHDGDYVEYCGRKVHITSWARKFSFENSQLDLPISYLSGGEQSRILIANLMLEEADLLILDEPTNDLDIQTLEVLEDCISEFPGAVILVSHDRMMLDTVSEEILAINGEGSFAYCADYNQCQDVLDLWAARSKKASKSAKEQNRKEKKSREKQGLTSPEKRALKELPALIEEKEEEIASLRSKMSDPEIASNFVKLEELMKNESGLKEELESMYERWQMLEEKALSS